MRTILEDRREIPVAFKVDVLVAGGGPAGFTAAVAAARNGARTIVVEKQNYIGGLLACLPIMGFYNYQAEQVIFGIPQELVDRLVERGGSPGHVIDPRLSSVTPTDSELLKVVTQEMAEEAGVEPLFHAIAVAPYVEGDTVKGLIVETKSGRQAILADVVVDATGDGDIAVRAGAPFESKEKSEQQPGNLMFRMTNVNTDKIRLAVAKNPDLARLTPGYGPGAEFFLNAVRFNLDGFTEQLEEARRNGDIPKDYPMRWVIMQPNARADEMSINMAMVTHFDATDGFDLTRAECEARRRIPMVVQFLKKYIVGFENAHLVASHGIIGVRESRRILGDATLQTSDVMENRSYHDGVAVASWALSAGHHPEGKFREKEYYTVEYPREGLAGCDVRYGCLLPKGIEGILTAGRCVSTTGLSQNAIRVMAPCMAIGQAAGTAAALAAKAGKRPRELDGAYVREVLTRQGVRFGSEKFAATL